MNTLSLNKTKQLLILVFLFLSFYLFYRGTIKTLPIRYWDEGYWIGKSYYLDLLIRGDFNNPLWKSNYAFDNPPLVRYIYGLVLYPDYLKTKLKKNKDYDLAMYLIGHNLYEISGNEYLRYKLTNTNFIDWSKNQAQNLDAKKMINAYGEGIKKTIHIIYKVREFNAIILATSVVLVYLTVFLFFGFRVALLSTFLYGFNDLVINSGLRAYSEGVYLLIFNFSFLLMTIVLVQSKTKIRYVVIFSILTALLTNTKVNGILVLLIYYALLVMKITYSLLKKVKIDLYKQLQIVILSVLIFILVFILVNPALYSNPLKNIKRLYFFRWEISKQFTKMYPDTALFTYRDRFNKIYDNFLSEKIGGYYSGTTLINVNILLFILGLLNLTSRIRKNKSLYHYPFLFFVSFILLQIIVLSYLTLNWDRYFVLLTFFFVTFKSLGIDFLLKIRNKLF